MNIRNYGYILAGVVSLVSIITTYQGFVKGVLYPRMANYANIAKALMTETNEAILGSDDVKRNFGDDDKLTILIAKYSTENMATSTIKHNGDYQNIMLPYKGIDQYYANIGQSVIVSEGGKLSITGAYFTTLNHRKYVAIVQKPFYELIVSNLWLLLQPVILAVLCFLGAYYMHELRLKSIQDEKRTKDLIKLLDSICIISGCDIHNKINYINRNFANISGYEEHELLGKDHNILNSQDGTDWAEMYNSTNHGATWHKLVRNKKKDGTFYYVDRSIVKTQDGTRLSIGYDVTSMIEQKNEMSKQFDILDRSAFMIRHDLCVPISAIKQIFPRVRAKLSDEVLSQNQVKALFDLLEKGITNLILIYEGVFDFTSIVRKGITLNKTTENTQEILKDFFKNCVYGFSVKVNPLPVLDVNKGLFCNAIDNLVRNGLKYNDANEKRIEINYDEILNAIEIVDNGRGMTKEQYEQFNQPYLRGNNKESGSGLGLSISRILFEKHGFKLDCVTQPTGTKMIVKL